MQGFAYLALVPIDKKSDIRSMLSKTRGIVFRSFKYGDSSLILDVLTEAHGLRSYIISGVRSSKSKSQASLCQVMSMLDLVVYERDDRDLNRVKEIKSAYVYQGIPFDIRKSAVGLFMVEVARKCIREREKNEPLFAFLWQQFSFLDATNQAVANLHIHFLLSLSGYLGFTPGGDFGPDSPFFDFREGQYELERPEHPHFFDERNSALMYEMLHHTIQNCHELALSRSERRQLLHGLLEYYHLHIDSMGTIHSHQILQEVLE